MIFSRINAGTRKAVLLFILAASVLILTGCGASGSTAADLPATPEPVVSTPESTPTPEPTPEPTPVPPVPVDSSGNFELYGRKFNIFDEQLDLNHIDILDNGTLVREVMSCMPNLKFVDMDFCRVDNEHMAEIQKEFPDVEVVWRVWFGKAYSVRTDVEKILASAPGWGGNLFDYNCDGLYHCHKVKYLDIGHNYYLKNIDFVRNMPDLEVFIIAQDNSYEKGFRDLTPLADCSRLEYLEVQGTSVSDLTPLSGLTELRHLNIGACPYIGTIEPIMDLELDRLWITGTTPVPAEQVKAFRESHPACEVNNTCGIPNDGWKWGTERYELLQKQFGYIEKDYQVAWNDPKYLGENQKHYDVAIQY